MEKGDSYPLQMVRGETRQFLAIIGFFQSCSKKPMRFIFGQLTFK